VNVCASVPTLSGTYVDRYGLISGLQLGGTTLQCEALGPPLLRAKKAPALVAAFRLEEVLEKEAWTDATLIKTESLSLRTQDEMPDLSVVGCFGTG
jgi:hypothetical protein